MSEKDKPAQSAAPQTSASSRVSLTEPVLKAKWEELAAMYDSKPRLASTIRAAKLEFDIKDDGAVVTFSVSNQAQKDWIEVKCLFEMEGRYQQLTGSPSVNLRVSILPEEEVVRKAYMPSEKAKELMEANEEVRNLVTDLAFDIK
jgi:DNA polymerase III, gamma and tau subunit